jgi:hypothetical protein
MEKRRVTRRDPNVEYANRTLFPHETVPWLTVDRNRALSGEQRDREKAGQEGWVYQERH